jgi:hypothetical protein
VGTGKSIAESGDDVPTSTRLIALDELLPYPSQALLREGVSNAFQHIFIPNSAFIVYSLA